MVQARCPGSAPPPPLRGGPSRARCLSMTEFNEELLFYRHLLVPIDGTDLSVEVVGNAAALARALGARITFFHAAEDHTTSLRGEADALRLTSPEDYAYAIAGRPRELLAKAEAAARALGVPCTSLQAVHDKPAQAIVTAAREAGC